MCSKKKKVVAHGIRLNSCGGRTRTCDLQVMSLASYQLLHSAMLGNIDFLIACAKVQLLFELNKYIDDFFVRKPKSLLFFTLLFAYLREIA